MVKGILLHLRCFLEGVEIPIVSCTVSSATGGPASANIELPDSEDIYRIKPRTIVHVFFLDEAFKGTYSDLEKLSNSRVSTEYKLLFCGEVFTVYHSKTGTGSRNATIMCLDFSNILDTSYIFQVAYNNTESVLGIGEAAQAQFIAGQSIGNNPFDNIVNSPQQLISSLLDHRAESAIHKRKTSKLGGLLKILELLLGVESVAFGINIWTSVHERITRLMDMIESDDGQTAARLFDQAIFDEWLRNQIGTQNPSLSYRELLQLILSYIYYEMTPIPTASYFRGAGDKDKGERRTPVTQELLEAAGFGSSVSTEDNLKYFSNEEDAANAHKINPYLLKIIKDAIDNPTVSNYAPKITDGYRTLEEATAIGNKKSLHTKGNAVDVLPTNIFYGTAYEGMDELFKWGRISLTSVRTKALLTENFVDEKAQPKRTVVREELSAFTDNPKNPISKYYTLSKNVVTTTDGKIANAIVNGAGHLPSSGASSVMDELLSMFGGKSVEMPFFYFLNYTILCDISLGYSAKGKNKLDTSIPIPNLLQLKPGIIASTDGDDKIYSYMNNIAYAMISVYGMEEDFNLKWLNNWVKKTIPLLNSKGIRPKALTSDHSKAVSTLKNYHATHYLTTFYYEDALNDVVKTYVTNLRIFWKAFDPLTKNKGWSITSGISDKVVTYGSPVFDFVYGIGGNDPVHFQIDDPEWTPAPPIDQKKAIELFDNAERLTGFLLRPDIWMCAPPVCNVIFPYEIVSLNISRDMMMQTTRHFLMTYDTLYSEAVVLNSHYFAPNFTDIPSINQISFGNSTASDIVYPHEIFTGIIPKVSKMADVAFYSKAVRSANNNDVTPAIRLADQPSASIAEDQTDPTINILVKKYAAGVAHYTLLKQRFSSNRISVTTKFLPRLIPGLPAVIIGTAQSRQDGYSNTHTWLGMISTMQHSIHQGGASTSIGLTTCRPYQTDSTNIDELLALKQPGKDLFNINTAETELPLADRAENVKYLSVPQNRSYDIEVYRRKKSMITLSDLNASLVSADEFLIFPGRYSKDDTYLQSAVADQILAFLLVLNCNNSDPDSFYANAVETINRGGVIDLEFAVKFQYKHNRAFYVLDDILKKMYATKSSAAQQAYVNAAANLFSGPVDTSSTEVIQLFDTRYPSIDGSQLVRPANLAINAKTSADLVETYNNEVALSNELTSFTLMCWRAPISTSVRLTPSNKPVFQSLKFYLHENFWDNRLMQQIVPKINSSITKAEMLANIPKPENIKELLNANQFADLDGKRVVDVRPDPATALTLGFVTYTYKMSYTQGTIIDPWGYGQYDYEAGTYVQPQPSRETQDPERRVVLNTAPYKVIVETTTTTVFDALGSTKPFADAAVASVSYEPVDDPNDTKAYGVITVKVPVVFPYTSFYVDVSENATQGAPIDTNKKVPLEEVIMPAWIDDAYKNGLVVNGKIDRDTGIGALYRRWFGCGSILDVARYPENSPYYTITIEDAVTQILERHVMHETNTHEFDRNIATLSDMLIPVSEQEINLDSVPKTGGFHSRSVGPYNKLELLGIKGAQLRSHVAASSTDTIVLPEAAEQLDPRKVRREFVLRYVNNLNTSIGKIG